MKVKSKRWTKLGLATAVAAPALMAACSSENDAPAEPVPSAEVAEPVQAPTPEAQATPAPVQTASSGGEAGGEAGEGEGGEGEGGEAGEAGHSIDTLPLPKRLAFMSGHVEAGLALYRAGEPEMAAPHLLHPVSETHAAEREGLDALGFDAAVFEEVSTALEAGRPADEIEPQLIAAGTNLAMMAEQAGGDPAEIISYLMDVIVEEYTIAITDGAVSDPGEYQDAFGFAVVAHDRATAAQDPWRDAALAEIDALLALWPEGGPIPPENPAPVAQVVAQTSRVLLALR